MAKRVGYARIALVSAASMGAALVGSSAPGCRTATQVTVELRTTGALTCETLRGVAIVVARGPIDAEERMRLKSFSAEIPRGECGADKHLLGTLVVTPSEGAGAIIVRARISDDPKATCEPPSYRGCIVSRRSFTFIDHAAVTLPITLEGGCLDLPCDVVTSCRSGVCVSSTAECSESSGTCESIAEPVVGPTGVPMLPDGALAPEDARPTDGSGGDGADSAVTEGGKDAEAGAEAGVGSNDCPVVGGPPQDCAVTRPAKGGPGIRCCFVMTSHFDCLDDAACMASDPGNPRFNCTGRLHCPGAAMCCHITNPGSGVTSDCGTACPGKVLCGTAADCPSGQVCDGILTSSPDGSVKFCQAVL